MRNNLDTVVRYMLEKRNEVTIYMDNIALHAYKFESAKMFVGLTCTTYQNSKGKSYLNTNSICVNKPTSPDIAQSKKQVSFNV